MIQAPTQSTQIAIAIATTTTISTQLENIRDELRVRVGLASSQIEAALKEIFKPRCKIQTCLGVTHLSLKIKPICILKQFEDVDILFYKEIQPLITHELIRHQRSYNNNIVLTEKRDDANPDNIGIITISYHYQFGRWQTACGRHYTTIPKTLYNFADTNYLSLFTIPDVTIHEWSILYVKKGYMNLQILVHVPTMSPVYSCSASYFYERDHVESNGELIRWVDKHKFQRLVNDNVYTFDYLPHTRQHALFILNQYFEPLSMPLDLVEVIASYLYGDLLNTPDDVVKLFSCKQVEDKVENVNNKSIISSVTSCLADILCCCCKYSDDGEPMASCLSDILCCCCEDSNDDNESKRGLLDEDRLISKASIDFEGYIPGVNGRGIYQSKYLDELMNIYNQDLKDWLRREIFNKKLVTQQISYYI